MPAHPEHTAWLRCKITPGMFPHEVGIDGKAADQLTFGNDVQHDARYSPDGTMLLYCRAPDPNGPWQICVQRLGGDEDDFVTLTKEGSNLLPDWHPDG